MCQKELYRPPNTLGRQKKKLSHCLLHHMAAFPAKEESFSFWNKRRSCSFHSDRVCVPGPPLGTGFAVGGGAAGLSWTGKLFLAQTGVGSDVTSASSSSGLGSSLAPEILLSFPVVLGGVEEVWSQPTLERQAGWRRWR